MLEMPHFPQTIQWHPVSIKGSYFVLCPDVAGVDEHVHSDSHFCLLEQRFFLLAVRFSSLKFSFPMLYLWDCSSTIRPYFCDLWSSLPNFEFFAPRRAAQDFLDLECPSEHLRLAKTLFQKMLRGFRCWKWHIFFAVNSMDRTQK